MKRGTVLAIAGAALGALLALAAFAPAAWLASALADASGGRLLLADARGSVWHGSAVPVLAGGPGSQDAAALPGRLSWRVGLDGTALALHARHDCCINGELLLRLSPGLRGVTVTLPASSGAVGQWPASWLTGLGTPFNTLQLGGRLELASGGLVARQDDGRWLFDGSATLTLAGLSSRISALDTLGSYRLVLSAQPPAQPAVPGSGASRPAQPDRPAAAGSAAQLQLQTVAGPLQLTGSGQLAPGGGLRFRGQAQAAPGFEAALANLLNIIGRRQGALSVLSIG